jgi:uncharacterized protein DUF6205
MGYEINVAGEILIEPPIVADEVYAAGLIGPGCFGDKDIAVRAVETPVDRVPGAYMRLAVAIVPVMSTYTAYHLVEHLQEVVDRWEDRTFTGRLDCSDPHTGALWRIEIHDRRVVKVTPRIVWPDGTEQVVR